MRRGREEMEGGEKGRERGREEKEGCGEGKRREGG